MSQRVRVLFAIGSLGGGGSERQVVEILRRLDRRRFQPLLYLVYRSGELLDHVPDDVPIFAYAERCEPSGWTLPGSLRRSQIRHLSGVLTEQRVDVVFDRTYHMTLITAPAAARSDVPRLSSVVSNPAEDLERTGGRYRRIKYRLLRRAYRQAACVIANSESLRRATIAYYRLPPENVETVYNLLDVEQIDRMAVQEGPTEDADRFHVVTLGRLGPEKGHRLLLEAVHELVVRRNFNRLLLTVAGDGPLAGELKAYVAAHGLDGHVRFPGFVPNPYSLLRRADLFCLPSLYEGMPNALLEAMACRVPVLATDCPYGPREILADGKYGYLVPPGDPIALADAIEYAAQHYDRWRELVEPAREHVERRFTPAPLMAKLEGLLLAACRQSSEGRCSNPS